MESEVVDCNFGDCLARALETKGNSRRFSISYGWRLRGSDETLVGVDWIDQFFKNWKKIERSPFVFLICIIFILSFVCFSEDDLYNWIVFWFDSIHFTRER